MRDTSLQAIWHDLNASQVALIESEGLPAAERRAKLATAQEHAKRADILLKQLLAERDA
jgi:hypothetical protein